MKFYILVEFYDDADFPDMKKAFPIGIFIFLVAAFAGYAIAASARQLPPFPAKLPLVSETDQSGLKSTLVILVDDLKSNQPVVESLWMVYRYPDSEPPFVFLPLYAMKDQPSNPEIQAGFGYGLFGSLSAEFRHSLEDEYKVRWDRYLILDNQALSQFTSQMTGKKASKILSQTPNPEKPADYSAVVVKSLQSFCSLLKSGKEEQISKINWQEISTTLRSDIPQDELVTAWHSLLDIPHTNPCNIVKNN